MDIPFISFVKEPYSSKYGSKGLQRKYILDSPQSKNENLPDSFKGKFYGQKKVSTGLKLVGGLLVTAFLLGTGKVPVSKVAKGGSGIFGKIAQTTAKGFGVMGKGIGNLIAGAGRGILSAGKGLISGLGNIFTKAKP